MVHLFIFCILISAIVSILLALQLMNYALWVLLAGLIVSVPIVYKKKFPLLHIILGLIIFFSIFFYAHLKIYSIDAEYKKGFAYTHNSAISLEGFINEYPAYRFSNNSYILKSGSSKIQIFTHKHQIFSIYQCLEIKGKLQDIRQQEEIWKTYYKRIGMHYVLLYPEIKTCTQAELSNYQKLKASLFHFKYTIRNIISEKFSSHTSALMLGMLFGEKNELSKEEKEIFNTAQLSHILVVSGYNVSLVLVLLFSFIKYIHRYIRICIAYVAIFIFVLLIGFDSSVVRAGLMGAILVTAKIFHLESSAVNTLYIVASGMLLYDPFIIYDAGFHLSCIATFALLQMPKHNRIPEYVLSTLWIFMFISLYILFMAGSISYVGIITNLSVLFLVPVFMFISAGSIILAFFKINILVDVLLLDSMSRYIFFIAQIFSNASKISIKIAPDLVVLFYISVFGLFYFFQNRYTTKEFIEKHYQKFVPQKPS